MWFWDALQGEGLGWLHRLRVSHEGSCFSGSCTMCSACTSLLVGWWVQRDPVHSPRSDKLTSVQSWVKLKCHGYGQSFSMHELFKPQPSAPCTDGSGILLLQLMCGSSVDPHPCGLSHALYQFHRDQD